MKTLLTVISLGVFTVIGYTENIMMTGVVHEMTCVGKDIPYRVRLEKRFLRDTSTTDASVKGNDLREDPILRSATKTGLDVKYGYPCGKYAIFVTSETQDWKKKLLGIHYYEWDGVLTAIGPLVPYTSFFWNQMEEVLYWVVVSRLSNLGFCDADIHIGKLSLSAPLDVPYPEFIDAPMTTWPQPNATFAKYTHRAGREDEGYIPLWFWTKVNFAYDQAVNMVTVGLVDDGLDGGTLTISYNVSHDTWKRSFVPSRMRLERESARERDKQRLLQEWEALQKATPP